MSRVDGVSDVALGDIGFNSAEHVKQSTTTEEIARPVILDDTKHRVTSSMEDPSDMACLMIVIQDRIIRDLLATQDAPPLLST